MNHNCPAWFVFAKAGMLSFVLIFYLFWVLPSMRQQQQFRSAMDRVFDKGEDCSTEAFAEKRYGDVKLCYVEWGAWENRNVQPHPHWQWPWAIWTEADSQ